MRQKARRRMMIELQWAQSRVRKRLPGDKFGICAERVERSRTEQAYIASPGGVTGHAV
jgi:hypothetical protein